MEIGNKAVRSFQENCIKIKGVVEHVIYKFNFKESDIFEEHEEESDSYYYKVGIKEENDTFYFLDYRMYKLMDEEEEIYVEELNSHYQTSLSHPDLDPPKKENHYDTVDSQTLEFCIRDLSDYIIEHDPNDPTIYWEDEELEPIDETYHFERGKDPKKAMKIGLEAEVSKYEWDWTFFHGVEEIIDFFIYKKIPVKVVKWRYMFYAIPSTGEPYLDGPKG